MSYATAADLETRFGEAEIDQLSWRGLASDPDVVLAALADADNEIDGYLAVLYQLPMELVPPLIVRIACDVARFRLWKDGASESVRQAYEDAVAALRGIAAGKIRLPVAGLEPAAFAGASPGSRVAYLTQDTLDLMP